MTDRKFYITTPLYYVNGELHIGGAYTTIAADILARWHRAHGAEVFFLTGSDEHGQKILREARERGMEPKQFADSIVSKFKELWEQLDITHDFFIRTTDDFHEKAVMAMVQKLMDNGGVYMGEYSGYYCTPCESYEKPEGDPVCSSCGRPLEKVTERNYFFRLSAYRERLLKHIESNPGFILPDYRRMEVFNRVSDGLDDLSISRSTFDWGVPVPGDSTHIIYVWVDALFNYITALGAPEETDNFKKFWPADVHLVGRDIIWFHCVIWPCLLMALGYEPPRSVFAHGWWTINGDKISKSKGNIVYPRDVIAKYGRDALRFFLMREVPFGRDGDFSDEGVDRRYHRELCNEFGNLLMRTVSMIVKYYDGVLPGPGTPEGDAVALIADSTALPAKVEQCVARCDISGALDAVWAVVRDANRYVENGKPWTLAKTGEHEKLGSMLYTLAECCRLLLVVLYPWLPDTAANGLPQLGVEPDYADLRDQERWGVLIPGSTVTKGDALFPRLEEAEGKGK